MKLKGDQPARLYRSRVPYGESAIHAESEQVGQGDFAKMLRVALSDPDDEVWRYSIRLSDTAVEGDKLRKCRAV